MPKLVDPQGVIENEDTIRPGTIVAFSGTLLPNGYGLCDGTLGTPDMRDHMVIGDATAGSGSQAGTESPTGLTHSGFALADHSNHTPTQPSAHAAHSPTQPSAHPNHVAAQPATHPTHTSGGAHTHDNHTLVADGSAAVAGSKITGPQPHSSDGGHTHDAHSAHTGWGVDAHSAHSGFAVDVHSAHSGFDVDAHSVHSVTQPSTHEMKHIELAYIMRL